MNRWTSIIGVAELSIILQENRQVSFEYGRYGNPTTVVLEEKIRFVCLEFMMIL